MDKIFKIGLLVLGVAFLVLFYFHAQNGRYQVSSSVGSKTILDTRKGIYYEYVDSTNYQPDEYVKSVNPITKPNDTKFKEWKRNDFSEKEYKNKDKNKYEEYLDHLKAKESDKQFKNFIKEYNEKIKKEAIEKGFTEDWKTKTE
jgi:hypothetical protein